jgi:hypothetical protein
MSRRIAILLLAASTALITTQAYADRECFENSCSLPGLAEPPPPPVPAPAAKPPVEDNQASAHGGEPSSVAAETKVTHPTPKPLEKVAERREPAPPVPPKYQRAPIRETVAPAPEYRPARPVQPVRQAVVRERPAPVSAPAPLPVTYAKPARRPVMEQAYAANERASASGSLIVNVPAPYATEGVAAVRPYVFYNEVRAPRLYVLAPNAKIIAVDGDD